MATKLAVDKNVIAKGTAVLDVIDVPAKLMDEWVKKIAHESGQRIDWTFTSGKAVVVALGNRYKVMKAIDRNLKCLPKGTSFRRVKKNGSTY